MLLSIHKLKEHHAFSYAVYTLHDRAGYTKYYSVPCSVLATAVNNHAGKHLLGSL